MTRIENWDLALFHWSEGVVGKPFRWGETDCATLVMDAMVVMYGRDIFPKVPRWKSLRKAVRVLHKVLDIADLFREAGAVTVPMTFAQSGDVLCAPGLDADSLPRLGVVVNGHALISQRKTGVNIYRMEGIEEGTELWRLPNG